MKSTISQLEEMLQEAKEKKSPFSKSIEKWLLSKYCSKGVSRLSIDIPRDEM